MSYSVLILWLCLAFLLEIDGLRTLYLDDYCERGHISLFNDAVELSFDGDNLSSYYRDKNNHCNITISQKDVHEEQDSPTRVNFYFTEFKFDDRCYSYVALYNIFGAIDHKLCGITRNLTSGNLFFSTGGDLLITIRWDKYSRNDIGRFKMMLNSYYDGNCELEGVKACENGRCVAESIYCVPEINACGDVDMEKQCNASNFDIDLQTFLDNVIESISQFVWIVILMVCVCVILRYWKSCRDKLLKGRQPEAPALSSRTEAVELGYVSSPTEVVPADVEQPSLIHSYTRTDDDQLQESDHLTNDLEDRNNFYGISGQLTPSAPPPSYDDVMKNEKAYIPTD